MNRSQIVKYKPYLPTTRLWCIVVGGGIEPESQPTAADPTGYQLEA
ncbi:MAG: hypothetical protein H7Z72_13175 [Bacteroidetes bacterium]|nr:hypothetical protein [Fibrella sp.]